MLQLVQVGVTGRLAPFSAQVGAGVQVHLIGPNGAGKSTLLARLAGMLPGVGEITLAGQALPGYQGKDLALHRAYLSQQQPPVALMPVFQYLALHQPAGAAEAALEHAILYLCRRFKLLDKLPRMLTQLSGGEWQRVRLAAVLLQVWPSVNPHSKLLLLDEPTNSLDVAQKVALDRLLREFCQSGRSALVCAHDLNHTLQQADRVWLLHAGRLVAEGPTGEVMEPTLLSRIYDVDFHLQAVGDQRWIMTRTA
ncbi:vitamin B12 ABC transporter ATP-binding protein BtuD [Serratia ficaria]|uniref:Vitamin B12 import ATP-binding protein BtuD n=1 Tax=Serratia ficaria TaxID=61651 RepID=A0A240BYF6_SERFI|nr:MULTISPECIES: vitamin B12 ABC transporter ATP-binding protein BtuD [Serratia]MEE4484505.1 vitamin B12 ABC transporter ATP-binding protein BtuD [Serratia ficaria]REF45005.1 vitamin B12 transport system ATP-binding protein [Serratia ficaria]CAI0734894.1 Vitamin B12 import ATP-binding protein BtuD [Serratia ficaria]CAI0769082.1 Vitamin B12 import ATP-binding protein BtuD [Serratia ficaria]CAI0847970.1 Vitamin B12 import ATP-binding protein BtuD [Serratia ficaria]